MLDIFESRLKAATLSGNRRCLQAAQGEDLSSNDYLGFANDSRLQQRFQQRIQGLPLGATGSRLLRGNLELHEQTEELMAGFVAREKALIFPSGYQANIALLSTVLNSETLVFSDALNHASIIDGIRLARAEKIIYPHRNLQALEDALKTYATRQCLKIIVTESLFSMDGTTADLKAIVELAQRYHAHLIVDEAHSTGIWSASLVAHLGLANQVLATVHSAGKALGAGGAWIACGRKLQEYLINFARPFIFSTAPVPALTILLQEAVQFYGEEGAQRANQLLQRSAEFNHLLADVLPNKTLGPIRPILLGKTEHAVAVAQALQQRNWDVRAIRPPTVPEGTARLRVTIKWQNSLDQLQRFAQDLKEVVTRHSRESGNIGLAVK